MPTERLTPGLKAEIVTTVDDKLVVKHMGGDGVLSTPSMIGLMERAGIEAVQAHLPEGHTTVGFEVNVKHFAATPKGKKVTVRAELLEVDGRKLRFCDGRVPEIPGPESDIHVIWKPSLQSVYINGSVED